MDDNTKMDVSATDRKPINGGTAIDETLRNDRMKHGSSATSYCVPVLSG